MNTAETAKGKLIKMYNTRYHFDWLFKSLSTPGAPFTTPAMMSVYCMVDLEVESLLCCCTARGRVCVITTNYKDSQWV